MEGLTTARAQELLRVHGHNILPQATVPNILLVFIKQFLSPLIYILLFAAIISMFLGEVATGTFILILLCFNSTIGAIQERSAQKAIISLQHFIPHYVHVLRDGKASQINTENLVPGDVIFLESGNKIPADLMLLEANNLMVDESLMTGESMPVSKEVSTDPRYNTLYAGTLIIKGRTKAQVIATGLNTKLGEIAKSVTKANVVQSPLLKKIEVLTLYLSTATLIFIVGFSIFAWLSGGNFSEILVLAIALAVAAVPEGLPTSITVALAVGVYRMSQQNVIVRKLIAVESLGSCTYIVSDKTGTLTHNKLSIEVVMLPDGKTFNAHDSKGDFSKPLKDLVCAGVLANEAYQTSDEFAGDFVDIAFLSLGKKIGIVKEGLLKTYKPHKFIPYESENKFSAGIYKLDHGKQVLVKGSYESILKMCSHMKINNKSVRLNKRAIVKKIDELAELGYKVIALASGNPAKKAYSKHFTGLSFLGIVGISDPLRAEAKSSINSIESAGVKVAMVTGDHPITALTIARNLGMAINKKDIVTGEDLSLAMKVGQEALDKLVRDKKVFAHIEPLQKKVIVEALMRMGHYVAVTGDGVNDAPALKYATIGVAMGKDGTDIARDSSEVILTDNNFTSIVQGIIQGRAVYSNVRKIVFLLISTGIAELFAFLLSVLFGVHMPLLAIQLLWLNIIINGIQDEAIGFEPPEGDELASPPRNPNEKLFDQFMTGRIFTVGLYIGTISFAIFHFLITHGYDLEKARTLTLLVFVLFGTVQALISKSEHKSIIKVNLLNNKVLFFGIIASHLLHVSAMHLPSLANLLHLQPVSLQEWIVLLIIASSLFPVEAAYRSLYGSFKNKLTISRAS